MTNYKIDPASPSRLIDGTRFVHNKGGGVASSHEDEFDRYWGFDKGTCYELATEISTSNYAVSKDLVKREFTHQDHAQVTAQLNAIIDSFHALK